MREDSLLSRRDAVFGGLCLCCASSLAYTATRSKAGFVTDEIAPGIHIRRGPHEDASSANLGAIANIGFIVGRESVAVVDPGGSLKDGEHLRTTIRRVTKLPIRHVIMTHVHPDHIFGAGAFQQDQPQFIGHAGLPRALSQRGEYYQTRLAEILGKENVGPVIVPDRLVENDLQIDLGARVVKLHAHSLAHTDCDLSVLDEQTQTLLAGDLLFVQRVPSLDGSLRGWLEELLRLREVKARRAVPGHGPAAVDWPSASAPLERYLGVLLRETREAVSNGIEIEAAVRTVGRSERDQWTLFDEYHGRNVIQAFKELEWE
jgi:quinoprotein relay system zinc metallohydrolase 2